MLHSRGSKRARICYAIWMHCVHAVVARSLLIASVLSGCCYCNGLQVAGWLRKRLPIKPLPDAETLAENVKQQVLKWSAYQVIRAAQPNTLATRWTHACAMPRCVLSCLFIACTHSVTKAGC
jgi:hypothetical protein